MGKSLKLRTALGFIVILHCTLIFGNITAFAILPFFTSWYIALPLMSYIGLLTFSRVLDCPLTRFENKLRRSLEIPEIKGFIGHYLVKPYVRYKRSKRKRARLSGDVPIDIHIPSFEQLAEHKKNLACDVKTRNVYEIL